MNRIKRLQDLAKLYKEGAISNEDFESLKNEILGSSNPQVEDDNKTIKPKQDTINTKGQIQQADLKQFYKGSKLIKAPNIEILDNEIRNKDEIPLLKSFIRLKEIAAPTEMTKFELDISKEIFTAEELLEIKSERSGFNYPIINIVALGPAIFLIYLIKISPCLMYLGGLSSTFLSVVSSVFILSRKDATKYDKIIGGISIFLIVFAWVFYGISWQEAFK
jgi:hypothetical protein